MRRRRRRRRELVDVAAGRNGADSCGI